MKYNKYLRRALSTAADIDALSKLRIYKARDGYRMQAGKLVYALDVPSPYELDVAVEGVRFFNALDACTDPKLKYTGKNLIITEGKFRAQVQCIDTGQYPIAQPDGERRDVPAEFIDGIRKLLPFMPSGEARAWMNGIILQAGKLYATNGFMAACVAAGFPDIDTVLPAVTASEIVKLDEALTAARVSDHSITFRVGDSAWLRSSVITDKVPDMHRIIGDAPAQTPVPEGLQDAVLTVGKFASSKLDTVTFQDGTVTCGDASVGGVDVPNGAYRFELLQHVLDVATHIDFSGDYSASRFSGNGIIGAFMSVRT